MTRQLRVGKGRHGLILANGGVMTYQHVLCLSTMRRRNGVPYPTQAPLPEFVTDVPVPPVDAKVEGDEQEAVIEVMILISHLTSISLSLSLSLPHHRKRNG